MRKIFFKMFACMARGDELISDELPELQAKEESESRASTGRMDSQKLSHEIWLQIHLHSILLNLQKLLWREIFLYK